MKSISHDNLLSILIISDVLFKNPLFAIDDVEMVSIKVKCNNGAKNRILLLNNESSITNSIILTACIKQMYFISTIKLFLIIKLPLF